MFIEIPVFDKDSVDPDQMLHSTVSDLDLHGLPVPFYGMQGTNGLYKTGCRGQFLSVLWV